MGCALHCYRLTSAAITACIRIIRFTAITAAAVLATEVMSASAVLSVRLPGSNATNAFPFAHRDGGTRPAGRRN